MAEVYEKVHTLIRKHRLQIQFQWVLCEQNKEADDACRAAYTTEGAIVMLDNTGWLSGGGVNIVSCPAACLDNCACDNSVTGDDRSIESEIHEEK